MRLINIGFGNCVNSDRIVAVVSPESAPIKRIIQECKGTGSLIDASQGRRTKSVIITDSDHVVLSYLSPDKIMSRINCEETVEEVELFE